MVPSLMSKYCVSFGSDFIRLCGGCIAILSEQCGDNIDMLKDRYCIRIVFKGHLNL